MSNTMFIVSPSPHIRSKDSIQGIMRDVLIALFPAALAALYFFKTQALLIMALSVMSAVAAEAIWQKLSGQKVTIGDLSAAVTGMILALNLSPTVPLWIPVVGSVFAIIIVKQFYGGLGQNFMNPALAAKAFLLTSWPVQMIRYSIDGAASASTSVDTAASASTAASSNLPDLWSLIAGYEAGILGEISAIALVLGGVYLILRRVISLRIPAAYIGTVFVLSWVLGENGLFTGDPVYGIFTGGLMLGAIFMATDYSTSPITPKGQIIMGIGCGILTKLISYEGMTFSILVMNLVVPLIDRYTVPKPFGGVK